MAVRRGFLSGGFLGYSLREFGLHCKPFVLHFSRTSAFSYRIPTLGYIE